MTRYGLIAMALLLLLGAGCRKRSTVPPPPAPNLFVLLPEPNGKPGGIVVRNLAGEQTLTTPYQATRVDRVDAAPAAVFTMDPAEVQRRFGPVLDVLPAPEVTFTLYFDEGRDVLNERSQAQIPDILRAVRERHSTSISITGHTDTVGGHADNYQLGLRRAQRIADLLKAEGLDAADLFVTSHGEADLLVKTPQGVAEERNRRVEVIVR